MASTLDTQQLKKSLSKQKLKEAFEQSLLKVKPAAQGTLDFVQGTLKNVMTIRILITVFICAWLIWVSRFILYKPLDDPQAEQDYNRYFNLHRVWFGDSSPLNTLFNLWFYVAIFWLLSPVIKQAAMLARLYLS